MNNTLQHDSEAVAGPAGNGATPTRPSLPRSAGGQVQRRLRGFPPEPDTAQDRAPHGMLTTWKTGA